MPRFISITCYQSRPKIKLFLQKNTKFLSAWDFSTRSTNCLRRVGATPPDPRNNPYCCFCLRACECSLFVVSYYLLFVIRYWYYRRSQGRGAGVPSPPIEMPPIIEIRQKSLVSSVACSIFAYNSTQIYYCN